MTERSKPGNGHHHGSEPEGGAGGTPASRDGTRSRNGTGRDNDAGKGRDTDGGTGRDKGVGVGRDKDDVAGRGKDGTGRGKDGGARGPGDDQPAARPVEPRRERYLVAALPPQLLPAGLANFAPIDADNLLAQFEADPTCTVRRVIRSENNAVHTFGVGPVAAPFPQVAVVEMDADRAAFFASTPLLHVEPDLPLQYAAPGPAGYALADPGVVPLGAETGLAFEVRGSDGSPLDGAEVYVMSSAFPVRGVTGADGRVELAVPAGAVPAVNGIYVKPKYDYWSVWSARPDLLPGVPNLVICPALPDSLPGLPKSGEIDGWARRAMRFDALPPTFRGHGIKIAIIDSGAATGHPDLTGRFAGGRDIPEENDKTWTVDTIGHGSHCAGIIGGRDNGSGILGVAPEAELHSCKIFPGGRFGDLIAALDYCITHGIDVVNLSLGSPQASELLAGKIEQARQAGVACVVAAGNSAGPVAFPASMPSVLAVAAIGKTGEFPPESYHATQVFGSPTSEGYFSAKFTCHGPEIDVCAPGVAIVSSVPPSNYAAWDGTSFAGPYVAGLAALVLAHHSDFRTHFTARDAARVDRLFDIIRGSSRPLALGDPGRCGAGLPDAVQALGLLPRSAQ